MVISRLAGAGVAHRGYALTLNSTVTFSTATPTRSANSRRTRSTKLSSASGAATSGAVTSAVSTSGTVSDHNAFAFRFELVAEGPRPGATVSKQTKIGAVFDNTALFASRAARFASNAFSTGAESKA